MSYELLIAWIVISIVALALPGPDFVYITSVSLKERRYGIFGGLGIQLGICCHLFLTYIGAVTLFKNYPLLFKGIQALGAAFLIYLAVKIIAGSIGELRKIKAASKAAQLAAETPDADYYKLDKNEEISNMACFKRGFFVNILNPKALIFLFSSVSQFLRTDSSFSETTQFLILSVVHVALGIMWWTFLATAVNFLSRRFAIPSFRCKIEIGSGAIIFFIALALLIRVVYTIYTGDNSGL
ncbi:LysE family translocator [Psittacicella hinzii]|uniref:Uncharacterized protein n=1 Tax=Psittacicella hinzii TaxID=2028575 RepID=A0A3A1YT26_9GAMM|nr:LysE family translocator [Psittacicella hinzii]RIY40641.1 hypothetical protein CKF58_00250 [Psittacicella hinzii]